MKMKSKEPFYTTLIEREMKPYFAFSGSNSSINESYSLMCIEGSSQALRPESTSTLLPWCF